MNIKTLKNTRALVICSMLAAIGIVLKILTIDFSVSLKLTLSFVPVFFAAILYGGIPAALVGICVDVIGTLLKGSSIVPLYTFTFIIAGLFFGILYKLSSKLTRQWIAIVLCTFVMQVICSVCMNGIAWSWMLNGYPRMVTELPFTLLKQLIYIPAYSALLIALTKASESYFKSHQ